MRREKKNHTIVMKKDSNLNNIFVKSAGLAVGALLSAKVAAGFLNKFSLNNKVVLITGGSRGLGLILARKFADEGAKVAICSRSDENLRRASKDLASKTNEHLAVPCDIRDKIQVKDMVQKVKSVMGSIDILVNNAGVVQVGPMETMKEEDYESAMKVHFWGPFYTINELLPDMIKKKSGRIVNIVSIGGKVSFPHLLPYNTSKYALSGLSEGMATELKEYNIKVTTVYPGLMRTGSPRNIDVKGQHEKEYAWFKISDSLPLLSMNADRAAERIISAMKKGRRTLTLTIPAKLAVAAHGIVPGLTTTFFDMINLLLPDDKNGEKVKKGYESNSGLTKSFLTRKTDEAAVKNLEK